MPIPKSPLERARRAALYNQAEFAAVLGVTQQTLSKYESGRLEPNKDRKQQIAKALRTRVSALWPAGDGVAEAHP